MAITPSQKAAADGPSVFYDSDRVAVVITGSDDIKHVEQVVGASEQRGHRRSPILLSRVVEVEDGTPRPTGPLVLDVETSTLHLLRLLQRDWTRNQAEPKSPTAERSAYASHVLMEKLSSAVLEPEVAAENNHDGHSLQAVQSLAASILANPIAHL